MSWLGVWFPRSLSIVTGVGLVLVATPAYADIELAPMVVIDFSEFEGTGFVPNPAAGELDSDDWSVALGPDGYEVPFGGTNPPGSGYNNGYGPGDTDQTGIWAFDVDGAGLVALGVQPGGQTFTPGSFTMRLVNNTGAEVSRIQVEFNVWVNNNSPRANTFDLQHSADHVSYTAVGAGFTSPADLDANGFTPNEFVEVVMPAAPIADGSQYYLRWAGDDTPVKGSYRDEFGLEGITIRILDLCGNGLVEKDETCDDGLDNANTGACTSACLVAVCGDGFVQDGVEACDDMNTEDGDDCPADCGIGGETTSGGSEDTTAGDSGSESASDTAVDTSGDSDASVTATDSTMSGSASGSVTDASATTATATGGGDTEGGESEGSTGEDDEPSGCSCTTSSNASGWGLLGLLGLAVARRRRR